MPFIELTRYPNGRMLINTDNISSIYMGKRRDCPICGVNVDKMSDYDYGFHIIDCQEKRIAELEQELKNQVELHNEWLGTYRIKLDYIEELERKIKRLTT